jgi:nitrate reductase cytochrome c-type subunit
MSDERVRRYLDDGGHCLYEGNHTRGPTTPALWHAWTERMRITHDQTECLGCHKWVIWKEKEQDA